MDAQQQVIRWITVEHLLTVRARQLIAADARDATALFPYWVEFMLFGSPHGGFNLNSEPEHDYRRVMHLKQEIHRDDFRRINWDQVRKEVREKVCGCEHVSHFPEDGGTGHRYGKAPAGEQRAQHVGPVCDDCAKTHMADHLVGGGERERER